MRLMMKLLVLCYLVAEVVAIYYISEHVKFSVLFIEVVVSAIIGAGVLLSLRFSMLETLLSFSQGKIGVFELLGGNFSRAWGAFLLILPGVICDVAGILFLIFSYFILRDKKKAEPSDESEVIDVEVSPVKDKDA